MAPKKCGQDKTSNNMQRRIHPGQTLTPDPLHYSPREHQRSRKHSSSGRVRSSIQREEQLEKDLKSLFILHNFNYKECSYFKIKGPSKDPKKPQCHCGEFEENHCGALQERDSERAWSNEDIKTYFETNAFGQIDFGLEGTGSQQLTEYVRLSDEDDLEKLLELMIKFWRLKEPEAPSLCISVIGGAKNFKMEGRKKEVFHQGLIKAAQTTNAWLITSGLNLGITRVVGDAVLEGQAYHHDKKRITNRLRCIGISPWGYVSDRERLIGTEITPTNYKISNVIREGHPVSLNQYHTHYIFVDDGIRRRYGGTQSAVVRSKLEYRLANPPLGSQEKAIPVVLVVVEGGHDVFIDCSNSIKQGVPVVICDGTGRAADIIAFVIKKMEYNKGSRDQLSNKSDQDELNRRLETLSKEKKDEAYRMLMEIVADVSLLTVFDMDKSDDLDKDILVALLKKQGENVKSQLDLALTWNRIDLAANNIFKKCQIDAEKMYDVMKKALKNNKVEFVRLLLLNGVGMKEYLSVEKLRELYTEMPKTAILRQAFRYYNCWRTTWNDTIYLENVQVLLRKMIGKHFSLQYYDQDCRPEPGKRGGVDLENEKFDSPFQHLFLWAVLSRHQTMAKLFWERSDEAISLALVATGIFQALSKTLPDYDDEKRRQCQGDKDEFEQLAVKVLEDCNEIDQDASVHLIKMSHKVWGRADCLSLAADAEDKKFLSSTVCQNTMDRIWLNNVQSNNWGVIFCVLFPFLIVSDKIVKLREDCHHHVTNRNPMIVTTDIEGSSTKAQGDPSPDGDKSPKNVKIKKKFKRFYTAPRTKFILNLVAYLVFLVFYSYFLLFGMKPLNILHVEYVVYIYLVSITIDEIREMFSAKVDTVSEKLKYWWFFSPWNRMDLCIIISFVIGAIFRGIELTRDPVDQMSINPFIYAKSFYVITGILFYIRVFRLYSAHPKLGPKLVMIGRMIQELILYISILVVALIAYGVAHQALLYPYRNWSLDNLLAVFYYPFWQLFGEIYLEETIHFVPIEKNCSVSLKTNSDGVDCKQDNFLQPLFLAFYLLVGNVLLLNLLIAIFSNIFQEVQENSVEIWKYKMYTLVTEYKTKPYLPMPFVIIEDVIRFFIFIINKCRECKQENEEDAEELDFNHQKGRNFQRDVVRSTMETIRQEKGLSMESVTISVQKRVEELHKLVEEQRGMLNHLHERNSESFDNQRSFDRENTSDSFARTERQNTMDSILQTSGATSQLKAVIESEEQRKSKDIIKDIGILPSGYEKRSSTEGWIDSNNPNQDDQEKMKTMLDTYSDRFQKVENQLESINALVTRGIPSAIPSLYEPSSTEPTTSAQGASGSQTTHNPPSTKVIGKKKLKLIESRLVHLEESTTRSLGNIEVLLRGILDNRLTTVGGLEDVESVEM